MSGVPNLKYKTSLCNAWKEGFPCQKGNFCFFAHGQLQLRSMEQNRDFLAYQSTGFLPQASHKYKTTYCKFYVKGDCKLGESCTFAHNKSQKRQKIYISKQQIIDENNIYYNAPYDPQQDSQYGIQMQPRYQYYDYYFLGQRGELGAQKSNSQQKKEQNKGETVPNLQKTQDNEKKESTQQ